MRSENDDLQLGSLLIFIGFFLVFAGILVTALTSSGNGGFGGLVMIGPIPVAFGSSSEVTYTMMWVGLVIALLYVMNWRRRQ
ncbi:MAG: TIGR00304 family membrane protein [Halobacteriota archaeon]